MNFPSTIPHLITFIETQLNTIYPNKTLCQEYAWWTLEAITKKDKAHLIIMDEIVLSDEQKSQLQSWLHKMVHEHMPLQYLIGSVPFNDAEILVEPPILIPRPETEEWTFNLGQQLKSLKNKKIRILDLCSGTGCIAVSLAQILPEATIVAADISTHAVELGKKNVAHNNLRNVTVVQSDLFDQVQNQQFDLIVSNPPYIAPAKYQHLDPSVTRWEDKNALIADDEGLAIIKKIIASAHHYLKTNAEFEKLNIPRLVLEIDYVQGTSVAALMKEAHFSDVQILKDLEQKDRVVTGR